MVQLMKKSAALMVQLLVLVTAAFLNRGAVPSLSISGMNVVINEFDSNPPVGPQWVELFNPTDFVQDISLWKIPTQSSVFTYTMDPGSSIPAKGYFLVNFPFSVMEPIGDIVYLLDRYGLQIDRTPSLAKPVKDDKAWARVPNGIDTDSTLDWNLQRATKGASNDVPVIPPTISCILSSHEIGIGSPVTVTVVVGPPRAASVTIQAKRAGELVWGNLTSAMTDTFGRYQYVWIPTMLGSYDVRAYAHAADTFPEMFSFPVFLFVIKVRTQLSCDVTHPTIRLGQDVATYGHLTPATAGVTISLTYRKPIGPPVIRHVQTGSDGLYNDTVFTPQEPGHWNVTASWEGDETRDAATSPLAPFYVEPPPATPFGIWLIVSSVVSISVSAVVLAAGLSRKVVAKPPRRVTLCPQCRTVLLYVPSLRGWYCPRCRRHFQ